MSEKSKKPTKKPTKKTTTKKKEPAKITNEKEFKASLFKKKKKPYGLINYARGVVCAIIYCETCISHTRLQGATGNIFTCDGCGESYAVSEYIEVKKLNKKQKAYLKDSKNIDLR